MGKSERKKSSFQNHVVNDNIKTLPERRVFIVIEQNQCYFFFLRFGWGAGTVFGPSSPVPSLRSMVLSSPSPKPNLKIKRSSLIPSFSTRYFVRNGIILKIAYIGIEKWVFPLKKLK